MAPKLNKVIRLDSLPANQTFFTPEGYLIDRPILTSIGIFEYTNPDGSVRRELRLPDEVFAAESLRSYQGKPIIITHDAGLVNKENVHDEAVGTILSEGYRDGDDVRAKIVIHDTDEMKDCGLKELSLGYNLDLDETPGVWNGMPYDAIQRNIRINHLALVREARAGDQARLNIDGRDSKKILKGGKEAMSVSKKSAKKTRRADGVLSPEALKNAIEAYKAKRAARIAAKADEEAATEEVVSTKPEGVAADNEVAEPAATGEKTIEEKVEMVKDRRDRRDEEGDPESTEEALGVIANQDEDIDILFDIIDTLLAEKEFDNAGEAEEPESAEDEGEEEAEEAAEPENEDEGEEETEGEGEAEAEETEEATDGECETENEDDDDDPVPSADPTDVNLDSIDRIVRERVRIGMIGRTLNMDGLEDMPLAKAKKTIIKAVRPGIRLDGKSKAYINAAFDCACDEIKARSKKDTSYQKKQMFNKDGRVSTSAKSSAATARDRMIARQHKKEEK